MPFELHAKKKETKKVTTCNNCNTLFRKADQYDQSKCPFCHSKIGILSKRKYTQYKGFGEKVLLSKVLEIDETHEIPVDKMIRRIDQMGSNHPLVRQSEDDYTDPILDDEEIREIISEQLNIIQKRKIGKYLTAIHTTDELSSGLSLDEMKFSCLSSLQNKIINMLKHEKLSYREIAFRLSGNRKGSYSCEQISYQYRSAKKKLLHFYYNCKGVKIGD